MMGITKYIRTKIFKLVTVLDILEYANEHRDDGLCHTFTLACRYYNVRKGDFLNKCTEFSHEVAASTFNGTGDPWWWESGVWDTGREKYLHYLINHYKEISPIYLTQL